MKRLALLPLICAVFAAPGEASARHPVVVELFTAQGCSSCVKANAWLDQVADRPGVIALTWSVDYWDYLGWEDTFAQPEYAERQQGYEHHFSLRNVYTPQIVVDGAAQASGDKPAEIDALINQAHRAPRSEPQVQFLSGGRIGVGTGRRIKGAADVWLIRFDPRRQDVEVTAGDNNGARVPQRDVVRQLERLGVWSGHAVVFKTPGPSAAGLTTLVLVQAARGGPIITATLEPEAEP